MLSSYFSNIRNLVFDQSSQVQPVSEYREGTLTVTDGRRTKDEWTKEILVSNIGCRKFNVGSIAANICLKVKS